MNDDPESSGDGGGMGDGGMGESSSLTGPEAKLADPKPRASRKRKGKFRSDAHRKFFEQAGLA